MKQSKRTLRQTKAWLHKLNKYEIARSVLSAFNEAAVNELTNEQLQFLLAVCKVAYAVGVENTRTPGQIYMEVV